MGFVNACCEDAASQTTVGREQERDIKEMTYAND